MCVREWECVFVSEWECVWVRESEWESVCMCVVCAVGVIPSSRSPLYSFSLCVKSRYLWYIRNGKSLDAILPINELSIRQINKDTNDVYNKSNKNEFNTPRWSRNENHIPPFVNVIFCIVLPPAL